ncbi:hypothetical protein Vretifemale_13469, partial [Volvox reticuliferus]
PTRSCATITHITTYAHTYTYTHTSSHGSEVHHAPSQSPPSHFTSREAHCSVRCVSASKTQRATNRAVLTWRGGNSRKGSSSAERRSLDSKKVGFGAETCHGVHCRTGHERTESG